MSAARRVGLALLGFVVGGAGGAGLGLVAGLAYTSLAATSGFEGQSGYVVAFWMLGGLVLGLFAGLAAGVMLGARSKAAP